MSDNNFSLDWLARKQKRIQSWESFLSNEIIRASLKPNIEKKIGLYSRLLNELWEKRHASPDEMLKIEDLERELEQFNEEARLLAG